MIRKATPDWTTSQAAKVSGLSIHMVNYLCRSEIVRPGGSPGRGRGRKRRFSFGDLVMLRLLASLLRHGISVRRLKAGLAALYASRRLPDASLASKYIVTDGKYLYFRDAAILETLETGQFAFAFVLDLTSIRKYVTAKVRQMAA